jgi:hypothetical protein
VDGATDCAALSRLPILALDDLVHGKMTFDTCEKTGLDRRVRMIGKHAMPLSSDVSSPVLTQRCRQSKVDEMTEDVGDCGLLPLDHVRQRRASRIWRGPNPPVQPRLVVADRCQRAIDLEQVGDEPRLPGDEPEPRALA